MSDPKRPDGHWKAPPHASVVRERSYLERLLGAVAKSHDSALSPVEVRLVRVAAELDVTRFISLALVEAGANWEAGKRIPDHVISRGAEMLILAAARVEDRLQGLRQDLEEHAKGGA